MAFTSKSGKQFSNRPMAISQDRRDEVSATKGMTNHMGSSTGMDDMQDSQEPPQVVAEHGPAEKVMISHEDGKHKVTSKHPDGHKHSSEHASKSEAHDTARSLSGTDEDEGAQDEMGDEMGSNPAMGM